MCMLEFLAPAFPRNSTQSDEPVAMKRQTLLARIARRLLFRMEVGTADKPATLYLSSVDLVPMGSWVVVADQHSEGPATTTRAR